MRVRWANSFVGLPAFGGKVRVGLAQQCGYCAPEVTQYKQGNHSSALLATAYPATAATAPGSGARRGPEANDAPTPLACKNADSLGKLSVKRFGECALDSDKLQSVAQHASGYSERYWLEPGFKRWLPV